jgi:hypothetical protein
VGAGEIGQRLQGGDRQAAVDDVRHAAPARFALTSISQAPFGKRGLSDDGNGEG